MLAVIPVVEEEKERQSEIVKTRECEIRESTLIYQASAEHEGHGSRNDDEIPDPEKAIWFYPWQLQLIAALLETPMYIN